MGDSQALYLRGTLTGHNGWITAIATGEPGAQDTVLTASCGMFALGVVVVLLLSSHRQDHLVLERLSHPGV